MTPLAMYIHVPFCVQKCPYCDFYSRPGREIPWETYTQAVVREMERWREEWLENDPRPLHSVFLGGGTPSLMPPAHLHRLLDGIHRHWALTPDCELTLEANPESATLEPLKAFRHLGINRLSLGVQALDPRRLAFLRRPHNADQARRAMDHARQAGFENINLDLIYATPGHTWEAWRTELEEALTWQPEHLSCYALTVEENTPLYTEWSHGTWELPEEETQRELFLNTRDLLAERGWLPYEISNFARPGQACRHNLLYWEYGDFLGLGPAAHGKLTAPDGTIRRFAHPADVSEYLTRMKDATWVEMTTLTPQEAGTEALLMGLRLERGLDLELHRRLTGEELTRHPALPLLLEEKLLEISGFRLRLTPQGRPLANAILARLA